jgi:dCMP deaminase
MPFYRPVIDLKAERLIPRPDWHEYFMAIAKVVSTRSTCSSRPVGCVVVRDNRILVTGYNGAPPGEPHCTDQGSYGEIYCARRAKSVSDKDKREVCPSVHAEENAVSLAERFGLIRLLEGGSIYTTLAPCVNCSRRLASAGIKKVYYELHYESVDKERDREWLRLAEELFEVFERVSLSGSPLSKVESALVNVTSERLLASV